LAPRPAKSEAVEGILTPASEVLKGLGSPTEKLDRGEELLDEYSPTERR